MIHSKYVGPVERLRGKGALVQNYGENKVKVQFDDQTLLVQESKSTKDIKNRYAFGWHVFNSTDFRPMEGCREHSNKE